MSQAQEVRGFVVNNFQVKQDTVKLTLIADKDDIGGGVLTLGDILTAFEIHSTSGSDLGLLVSPADQDV
jgi:hypothetical protein